MKLSFSTNGWVDYSFKELCDMAKDYDFQGIEIHNIKKEIYSGKGRPFSAQNIAETEREISKLGIEIPCIDTTCNISDRSKFIENCEEIEKYIEVAKILRCPNIRLRTYDTYGDKSCDEAVSDIIKKVIVKAENSGVSLLIETVGAYADTKRLRNLLDTFASDNIGALWDFHHPYRTAGESPDVTIQNLGAFVKHVHIKDSDLENNASSFLLVGEGSMPLNEMMNSLRSINYDHFISFEWIPGWLQELSDPEIVFPHFVNYISRFDEEKSRTSKLYNNKRNTGKYIWEKDAIIDLTFSEVLDRVVEEFPDQYAFRYTTLNYTRTYSEFSKDVDDFARALIALGVKRGTHVAVWATNIPQWYISFWAAVKIGAVLVTVNTAYKIHEAEYLLRNSDTHTLIMIDSYRDSNYVDTMQRLCPELKDHTPGEPLRCKKLPFLRNIINVTSKVEGCLTWEDIPKFASKVSVDEVNRMAAMNYRHEVCNMQYTSGTTGFPKGVMLTHHNVVNNGKCIGDRMDLSTADRMLIHVPMFHCFGMVLAMTAAMTHGATLSPLPYFAPKAALTCINQERITCFHGVPTMFIAMLEHEDFPKTDFSYMRTGIMAGSPCPISVMQDVLAKMNMNEITIVFGQTESSPGCTMSSTDDPIEVRVGTVGRPLPGVECKIVDPETNLEMPVGETGEFVARGYNIMKGYYKMPKATSSAIDADGWLHTGDLACKTPEGNYKITGRLKDMIIRGGENIYPKEIEEFIYTHPKVKDVQVIGVPDEQYGEEIMACIIIKEGEEMTEDEMKAYIRANMARHKLPKYIDFVSEFPMNAAGKIMKYKMREAAVEKLGLHKANSIETA